MCVTPLQVTTAAPDRVAAATVTIDQGGHTDLPRRLTFPAVAIQGMGHQVQTMAKADMAAVTVAAAMAAVAQYRTCGPRNYKYVSTPPPPNI